MCRVWSIWQRCATASCGLVATNKVNPLQPVELVIDHSVQGIRRQADAFELNASLEFSRNKGALRVPAGDRTRSATSASFRLTPASSTR